MTERRINAGILGTGHYLPPHILTNEELAQRVDTSDAWITSRTGIHARRIAAADVPATALAEPAARMALADAGIEADAIDLIIFATLTPDRVIPAAACELQRRLGAVHAAAFDLSAACSGFVYAAAVACQFIEAGIYRHVLVIGAEELSKVVDWQDRGTCILFGDGAGAAVFGPVSAGLGALAFDLGADGSQGEALTIPASGSLHPVTEERLRAGENFIHMDGKAVFRFAVTVMGKTVETSLARAGLTKDALDWLVPHQANIRIIEAAAKRLSLPLARVIINIENYGNMSAASIPVALSEAAHAHRFRRGDRIALAGFGAGLTWASCILRWAKED